MEAISNTEKLNHGLLEMIEEMATRVICLNITIRALSAKAIDVQLVWRQAASPKASQSPPRAATAMIPTLVINTATIVSKTIQLPAKLPGLAHIYFGKANPATGTWTAFVRGRLPWAVDIKTMLPKFSDPSVKFVGKDEFVLQLECPTFESFDEQLTQKLNLLLRATTILRTLEMAKSRVRLSDASLEQVTFTYANRTETHPQLSCRITLGDNDGASVDFLPAVSNPHQRIRLQLSGNIERGLPGVLQNMQLTLPVLSSLARAELRGNSIRTYSFKWYRLVYKNVPSLFEILGKVRNRQFEWHISELRPGQPAASNQQQHPPPSRPPGYDEALDRFFKTPRPDVRSTKNLLACQPRAVEKLINELDDLVRSIIARQAAAGPTTNPNAPMTTTMTQSNGPTAAGPPQQGGMMMPQSNLNQTQQPGTTAVNARPPPLTGSNASHMSRQIQMMRSQRFDSQNRVGQGADRQGRRPGSTGNVAVLE
jgi:hypothetical protein